MRVFASADGRSWTARVYDGPADERRRAAGVGWEAILFEVPGENLTQRIEYRPVGWLARADAVELQRALEQAESVRARWGGQPLQSGAEPPA